MSSPFACDFYGKNLGDIQDEEFEECPGPGCADCDWCVEDQ